MTADPTVTTPPEPEAYARLEGMLEATRQNWVIAYERANRAEADNDRLRDRLALIHAWALDEQQQRHAVEDKLVAERSRLALAEQALVDARGEITDLEVDRERLHQDIDAQLAVVEAARDWYRDFTDRDAWIATGVAIARLDETTPTSSETAHSSPSATSPSEPTVAAPDSEEATA